MLQGWGKFNHCNKEGGRSHLAQCKNSIILLHPPVLSCHLSGLRMGEEEGGRQEWLDNDKNEKA